MNTKEEKYAELFPQIKSILEGETDMIANMANVAAVLHEEFKFWWTGFYRVVSEDTLLLGPFQGPLACTRIKKGRGVCGTAWEENTTQVVPDVCAERPGKKTPLRWCLMCICSQDISPAVLCLRVRS